MTRAQLIQAVALRMDEITPDAGLQVTVDGSDNNPLYTLIDGLIDSGVLELYTVAPYWRLTQKPFDAEDEIVVDTLSAAFGERKIIRLKVTDDFLRVAEIGCADFLRPITEVFGEQDSVGKRQHNRFLMGKEAKPVGVMSHGMWEEAGEEREVCREIDCYSLASDSSVTAGDVEASYIPKPVTIKDTVTAVSVESVVPSVLIPALEWIIASRTFGARGDANHAAICQQNAQNLLT